MEILISRILKYLNGCLNDDRIVLVALWLNIIMKSVNMI